MPFYHFLADIPLVWTILGIIVLFMAMAYAGAPFWAWTLGIAVVLYGAGASLWLWLAFTVVALIFNLKPIRRRLITASLMAWLRSAGFLPSISETEQVAIEAGSVWVDGELFSGRPDFNRLMKEPYPDLTEEERRFLEGPVEEVCRMTDDWDAFQRGDLPEDVWDFLKKERFFGMIIPKEYGGLGFSALANSAVVKKTVSRSLPLSITVMVPNSLGPAELLIHYGTEEQRNHYLPRLAVGDEIPAFALTEPGAGSDAGAITASGEVFRGDNGEMLLRLNWEKRYITLAAVSTLLGLAFKLYDPDNLLGKGTHPGITVALIPTDTPGVETHWRHDPLGIPFINSRTTGRDVVVPVDAIIGGAAGAGRGWQMLMESLSAGRGISLPAQSTGGAQLTFRVASGHAAVRKQFGLQLGRFEGIEEPLARIGGLTYVLEAARRYTCGGIDQGAKPAVVTAMAKYNATELQRLIINDGMDILGGNAIVRGPRNLLAHGYMAAPIGITVEGANILTRTMIIFGQGAIRAHPYAYQEIDALARKDLTRFDEALWSHIHHVVRNKARAVVLTLSRGYLAGVGLSGPARRYAQKLAWASASFAFFADLAMASLGGQLKRKEKITGRFADILSWLYLGTATIRRFEAEGHRKEDLPFFEWAMEYSLGRIQEGFDALFENLRVPGLTWWIRGPAALWSRINRFGGRPSDRLGHRLAALMQTPGPQRDRFTEGIFLPGRADEALGRLERAFVLSVEAEDVLSRLRTARREGRLTGSTGMLDEALGKELITPAEKALVEQAEEVRQDYIRVDAFTLEEYGDLRLGAAPSDGALEARP